MGATHRGPITAVQRRSWPPTWRSPRIIGITVQLCGDAHILNFGLWNTPERRLAFDLRDFDETLPGPFKWDLKRYLASIVVLARGNGLPTVPHGGGCAWDIAGPAMDPQVRRLAR